MMGKRNAAPLIGGCPLIYQIGSAKNDPTRKHPKQYISIQYPLATMARNLNDHGKEAVCR